MRFKQLFDCTNVNYLKLAALVISSPFWLTACGGSSSSTTQTDSTIAGTATKGPIGSATVTIYSLNEDGTRGVHLAVTTTDASGNYSVRVDHDGPAAVVVTGGSYVDEASGMSVALEAGVELQTFIASADNARSVGVTALTTIAASRAAANAEAGLATAIAAANAEVSTAFGLAGVDITSTIPSDLTDMSSVQDSRNAKKYGLIQAGLTQLADVNSMAPESVLTMIGELAEDFSDGRLDGMNAANAAITSALEITPQQAYVGLSTAMSMFLQNPRNESDVDMTDVSLPGLEADITGQATKGPVADATVRVYALNEDGTRGRLLGTTISDAAGNYALQVKHDGTAAVVVSGGSYSDEATGTVVALGEHELETLVANLDEADTVAVTALTTIAAQRASANASAGLATAIAAANVEVAAMFGLEGVDLTEIIPSDMTNAGSAEDSAAARSYGLVQSGLTQTAEDMNLAPEDVLTLVSAIAEDFSDGNLDGMNAAGAAITSALEVTPEAALMGLNAAMEAFLNSAENASGLVSIPAGPRANAPQ